MNAAAIFSRSLVATACLLALPAAAQTSLPGSAQPGQVERRFEPPQTPLSTEQPIVTPERDTIQPPPGAEQAVFTLRNVVVEGATVYPPEAFRSLYQDLVGQKVNLKQVYDLANAVTARYVADGYLLSQALVPPQRINGDGVVRLRVVEGFIDKVTVEGEVRGRRELLERLGAKIAAARPLTTRALERYLLLADDLPGATVQGVLTPSATTPGAADLALVVKHKPVDAFASVDNRGTKYVGPVQLGAGVNLNSLLGRYEQTSLRAFTTAQPEELKYLDLTHEQPLGTEGTRFRLGGAYVVTQPGATLKNLDIDGKTASAFVGLSHPVIRSRRENLTLQGRFEVRNVDTDQAGTEITEDRLRVVRLGESYDFVDTALGSPAINLMAVEVSQGLDVFGARGEGSPNLSRPRGSTEFTKVTVDISRLQRLYPGLNLLVATTAQISSHALLASEEFSFGGAAFGRGYDPSEISGDSGVAARAELQYGLPGSLPVGEMQLYGFYDIGKVRNRDAAAGDETASAASAGLGVRGNVTERASYNLELARPLTRGVAASENEKDWRLFFSLVGRY